MLVYTTLFTLGKNPKENKYLTMFYMWFTYLNKYSGLGPSDSVGIIVDQETFDFMNSDGNQILAHIVDGIHFNIEFAIMRSPANLSEGFAERYRAEHFETFTKHELNLHIDIDCLCIRNIHSLFSKFDRTQPTFFAMSEFGYIYDDNHGGNMINKDDAPEDFPGLSAGWYAWMRSDDQRALFDTVLKRCLDNAEHPFYTVDQPFYNHELLQVVNGKKVDYTLYVLDSDIVVFNPYISDISLAKAYFANFAGEPGVEDCHFNKIFTFLLMDFSSTPAANPPLLQPQPQEPLLPASESGTKEHGLPEETLAAGQEEAHSHTEQHGP